MALGFHPDKNKMAGLEESFEEMGEVYEVLSEKENVQNTME